MSDDQVGGSGSGDRAAARAELHRRFLARKAELSESMKSERASVLAPPPPELAYPKATTRELILGGGILLVLIAGAVWAIIAVGGWLLRTDNAPEHPPTTNAWVQAQQEARHRELVGDAPPEAMDSRPAVVTQFDESRAVTLCDLNMRAQMNAPSSYRSEWGWQTVEQGGVVGIRRGFSATNALGLEIDSEYTCLVGALTNQIVGIQYNDAGRTITIPGADLSQE